MRWRGYLSAESIPKTQLWMRFPERLGESCNSQWTAAKCHRDQASISLMTSP
jgi:hypothetical protein